MEMEPGVLVANAQDYAANGWQSQGLTRLS